MPTIGEIRRGKEIGICHNDKVIYHACIDCGKERWVVLRHGQPLTIRCLQCACKTPKYRKGRSMLAKSRRGNKHPNWRGGKKLVSGYIQIWVHPDDFYHSMAEKASYIPEHRLVMAKYLNRCLLTWEAVHHKNGIKTDNRLENLELLTNIKHNSISKLTHYIRQLEKENAQLRIRLSRLEK